MKVSGFAVARLKDNFEQDPTKTPEQVNHATVAPINQNRFGLHVQPLNAYLVGANDRALLAAGSNLDTIVFAAAHGAKKGDLIRFTNAVNVTLFEIYVKEIVDATTIKIHGKLDGAIDNADTVDLLRPVTPRVDNTGASLASVVSPPIQINRGPGGVYVPTTITKDTTVAANTVPLPVEIVQATGTEINITAGDINVQLTHAGANPDSTQIGDGTEIWQINAAGEGQVAAQGNVAANAADTQNPIKIGGRYDAILPTYDDGDITNLQVDINGRLLVTDSATAAFTTHDLDTGAGTEDNLGVSVRISGAGGSIEAKGQQARADSLPATLSTEDITLITAIRDRLPAALGQAASAASLAVVLSTEQEAIVTAIRDRLPASIGQQARAASLSVTHSTEDLAVHTAIRDRLPSAIGQTNEAGSLSVALATEQDAVLTSIDTKLPASLGQKASAASLATVLSTEQEAIIQSITDKLPATLGQKTKAASLAVTLATDEDPINIAALDVIEDVVQDLTGVTNAAWTQIVASTSGAIRKATIFMSSGKVLEVGTGAAASETKKFSIAPGGWPGQAIEVSIPASERLSVKFAAGEATGVAGERVIIVFQG
jgi:predicted transcriptional regulator